MKIEIRGDNKAPIIQEIKLSKNKHLWSFYIYTKDLYPFGSLSVLGDYSFCLSFKMDTESSWTTIEFIPENKEEKQLFGQKIVISDGKTYYPERTKGQFCQQIYIIKKNDEEEKESLPLLYKQTISRKHG